MSSQRMKNVEEERIGCDIKKKKKRQSKKKKEERAMYEVFMNHGAMTIIFICQSELIMKVSANSVKINSRSGRAQEP